MKTKDLGIFVIRDTSAILPYSSENNNYSLAFINADELAFLHRFHVGDEVVLHKSDGNVVTLLVVQPAPQCKAVAKR